MLLPYVFPLSFSFSFSSFLPLAPLLAQLEAVSGSPWSEYTGLTIGEDGRVVAAELLQQLRSISSQFAEHKEQVWFAMFCLCVVLSVLMCCSCCYYPPSLNAPLPLPLPLSLFVSLSLPLPLPLPLPLSLSIYLSLSF